MGHIMSEEPIPLNLDELVAVTYYSESMDNSTYARWTNNVSDWCVKREIKSELLCTIPLGIPKYEGKLKTAVFHIPKKEDQMIFLLKWGTNVIKD